MLTPDLFAVSNPLVPTWCDDDMDCVDGDGYGKMSAVMEIKLWDGVGTGKIRGNAVGTRRTLMRIQCGWVPFVVPCDSVILGYCMRMWCASSKLLLT